MREGWGRQKGAHTFALSVLLIRFVHLFPQTSGVATVSAAMGRAQGREPRLLAMQLDGACGEEEVRKGGQVLFFTFWSGCVECTRADVSTNTLIQLTGALEMIIASTDTVEVFFRKALERRWVARRVLQRADAATCAHILLLPPCMT